MKLNIAVFYVFNRTSSFKKTRSAWPQQPHIFTNDFGAEWVNSPITNLIFKNLYSALYRSKIDFGCQLYSTASSRRLEKFDGRYKNIHKHLQNVTSRIIACRSCWEQCLVVLNDLDVCCVKLIVDRKNLKFPDTLEKIHENDSCNEADETALKNVVNNIDQENSASWLIIYGFWCYINIVRSY